MSQSIGLDVEDHITDTQRGKALSDRMLTPG